MEIRPETLQHRERYALLISLIVPRPIAWISSCDSKGNLNLAPFSFYAGLSASPPLIGVSIGERKGVKKDTWRNLEETREAVVHIPTEDLAESMVASSGDFRPEVDEFAVTGLTPIESTIVRPSRIAEAQVAMECRVEQILEIGDPDTRSGFVIARIVCVHLRDDLWDGSGVRIDRLRPVGRLGGRSYCRVRDTFEMERPKPGEIR